MSESRANKKTSEWLNILYFIFWPTLLLGLGWIGNSISGLQLQVARIEVSLKDVQAQKVKLEALDETVRQLNNRVTILETKGK